MFLWLTYDVWHQDDRCETQETQRLRVHPHRPGDRRGCLRGQREKNKTRTPNLCNPPVEEGGEDEDAEDAEGQVVEDVGQEHLPFAVETILALLVTDGSQRRNWQQVRRSR